MKKLLLTITALICLTFLFGCTNTQKTLDEEFGFCRDDFVVIEEVETHGGFNGDGSYYLTLDCSNNLDKANEVIKDWHKLPLTENLMLIMYGGVKDGGVYGAVYGEEYDDMSFPKIENGYYMILNRHNGKTRELVDDLGYFSSNNYTIAIYDSDNEIMYYFECDF